MSSRLIVEVCKVLAVDEHPNADRMAVATVKGWKTCISKDPATGKTEFRVGDKCIYVPPGSVVPIELSDRLGNTQHLVPLPEGPDGMRPPRNRVHAARLRGVPSYGFVMRVDNPDWKIGYDVSEYYGITKWDPPEETLDPNADVPHPTFHHYTNIELWQNFPDVLREHEEVVITEKLHGKTSRVGYICVSDEKAGGSWEFMCGSHDIRRKQIDSKGKDSVYWIPFVKDMQLMLMHISGNQHNVIAAVEIFGSGMQDTAYGLVRGNKEFRLFDIAVDGTYMDVDDKIAVCKRFSIPMVPILYRGPYSRAVVEEFTHGPTAMCDPKNAGKFKGREGIVITPVKERFSPEMGGDSRVIFKSISTDFLQRKGSTDSH